MSRASEASFSSEKSFHMSGLQSNYFRINDQLDMAPPDTTLKSINGEGKEKKQSKNHKITATLDDNEAILRGVKPRIFWGIAKHILPMGISALLVWMNWTQKFWFHDQEVQINPSGRSIKVTYITNILQFAAKIHELLIVYSLFTMCLNVAKRCMVGEGLPFGLVTGAYRIGDFGFLMTSAFWKGMRSSLPSSLSSSSSPSSSYPLSWLILLWKSPRRNPILLGLLTILCTSLGIMSGPASAILMIPSLEWWPLREPFAKIMMPLYYDFNRTILPNPWPTDLNSSFVPEGMKCNTYDYSPYYCPGAGNAEINTWVAGWPFSGLESNIAFRRQLSNTSRLLVSSRSGNTTSIATTLTVPATCAIGTLLDWINHHDVGPVSNVSHPRFNQAQYDIQFQPVTRVSCSAYDRAEALQTIRGLKNDDGVPEHLPHFTPNFAVPFSQYNSSVGLNNVSFEWVTSQYHPFRLFALANLPYFSDDGEARNWLLSCEVAARWVPSHMYMDPIASDRVDSNVTEFINAKHHNGEMPQGADIQIRKTWADLLNVDLGDCSKIGNQLWLLLSVNCTMIELQLWWLLQPGKTMPNQTSITWGFGPKSSDLDSPPRGDMASGMFSTILSLVVAEGLARIGSAGLPFIRIPQGSPGGLNVSYLTNPIFDRTSTNADFQLTSQNWDRLKLQRSFNFDVEQYGYGSGARLPTIRFGLIVNYVYLAVITIYGICLLIYHLRLREVNTIMSCDTLEDMVALAFQSRAPRELSNKVGVEVNPDAWKQPVKIRTSPGNGLELTISNDPTMKRITRASLDGPFQQSLPKVYRRHGYFPDQRTSNYYP